MEQLLDPAFQTFVKDIDASVPHFESSTGTFMTDMIRFGPSKYDIAVVYESLAVSQLENAQGRWGSLHIYYPPVTIWSDHPIVLLDTPKLTKDAARRGDKAHRLPAQHEGPGDRAQVRVPAGGSVGADEDRRSEPVRRRWRSTA